MLVHVKVISIIGAVDKVTMSGKHSALRKNINLSEHDKLVIPEDGKVVLHLSNGKVIQINGSDLSQQNGVLDVGQLLAKENQVHNLADEIQKIETFVAKYKTLEDDFEEQGDLIRLENGRVFQKNGKDYIEIETGWFQEDPTTNYGGHRFVQLTRIGEQGVSDGYTPLTLNRIVEPLAPLSPQYPETNRISQTEKLYEWSSLSSLNNPLNVPNVEITLQEDQTITGRIAATETDIDQDKLSYTKGTDPEHGIVVINKDGTYTYTPHPDYHGKDSFTVIVEDGLGGKTETTITVTVNAEQDAFNDTATVNSGQSVNINVLTNDPFEGSSVAVSSVTQGANGSVSINPDGTVKYTANAGFTGSDSFTYTAIGSTGVAETATVTVTVGSNPTTISGAITGTGTEDAGTISGQITAADLDGLDATTPYSVTGTAAHGLASVDVNGNWTYVPVKDYNGADSFVITVKDALGNSSTQTITVTVSAEQDAFNDTATVNSGQSVNINVLTNDQFEGSSVAVSSVTQGANGSVSINPDGTVKYTANAGFTGSDSFTYTAIGSTGVAETATVTVTVGSNPTTISGAITGTGTEDAGTISGQITAADLDGLDATTPYSVTGTAAHGLASVDVNGNWTYVPAKDYNGSDSFVITVKDALGNSSTQTITVTVSAEQDAFNDTATVNSGQSVNINVLTNDQFEGSSVAVSSVTQGANGSVSINPDGTVKYTANAGFTGSDSFTYTAIGSTGVAETATVTVTVGSNPTTISGAITGTGTEDAGTISGQITAADLDGLDATTPYSVTGTAAHGLASVDVNGNWTYVPAKDYNGSDSFVITVKDALGNSSTQTITVTVNAEQDAFNDTATVNSGQSVNINVLTNDQFEGSSVAVSSVTQGANGSVSINPDGTVKYTANAGFTGSDSFTYTAIGSTGVAETATVTVTVGSNPTTISGAITGTGTEDAGTISGQITAADLDGLDATTPYSVTGTAAHGLASVDVNGNWTYVPAKDYNGSDSFVITVKDALGNSSTQTITVTVNAEQDAFNDTATVNSGQSVNINVLTNDPFEGSSVAVSSVTQGANGSVSINPDGTVKYTANAGFTGSDSFTYTAIGSTGVAETATVTVTVGSNPTTISGAITGTGTEDAGTISGQITAADLDGLDATTPYSVTGTAAHGLASVDVNGNWTYVPAKDYNGSDSFVITVKDALGNSSTQTITVTVSAEQDAFNDTATVNSGQSVNINVLTNDQFEGSSVAVSSVTQGANGSVSINPDGTVKYTANAGFTGSDSFTYTAIGSTGVAETATVTVTVGSNPTTISGAITGTGTEDAGTISGQITAADLDGLDATTPYSVTGTAAHGLASVDVNGNWTYVPAKDYNGSDSFVITVKDALGNSSTQTITVTVNAEQDAFNDTATVNSGQSVNINVLTNDQFEGSSVAVSSVTQGANGSVSINPDGTVKYTANAGFTGSDSFTYTAIGSTGVAETATVTVTVGSNPTTISGAITGTGTEDAGTISGQITAADLDGLDATTPYSVTGTAAHGLASVDVNGNWTYVPAKDYNGSDSFVITVKDALGNSSTQTITVTVSAEQDAFNDTATVNSGQSVNINVLTNDQFEGSSVAVSSVTQGANGSVSINPDGTVKYTANAGFTGSDSFTYTAIGSTGVAETATVTVTVTTPPFTLLNNLQPRVSEEGLTNANPNFVSNPDTTGSSDTTNLATTAWTTVFNTNASTGYSYALTAPVTPLTSNGVAITWVGVGTATLVGQAAGIDVVRIQVNASGQYQVTLLDQVDHATVNLEDVLSFGVGLTVTDLNNVQQTTTINVAIEDDSPIWDSTQNSGNPTANITVSTDIGVSPVQGDLNIHIGADNGSQAKVVFTAPAGDIQSTYIDPDGGATKTTYPTYKGMRLHYEAQPDGSLIAKASDGTAVFKISGDLSTDKYSIEMYVQLDQTTYTATNFAGSLKGGNTPGTYSYSDNGQVFEISLTSTSGGTSSTVNTNQGFFGVANNWIDGGEVLKLDFGAKMTGMVLKVNGLTGSEQMSYIARDEFGNIVGTGIISVGGSGWTTIDGQNGTFTLPVSTFTGGSFQTLTFSGVGASDSARIGLTSITGEGAVNQTTTSIYVGAVDSDGDALASTKPISITLHSIDEDFRGTTGNDYFDGGTGDDRLFGDQGNDTLFGNVGNDQLYAGAGNDILIGGAGSDILSGSTDADTFVWGKQATGLSTLVANGLTDADGSTDIIKDFSKAEGDKIDAKALLNALGWDNTMATLGNYVSVSGNTIDIHNTTNTNHVSIVVENHTFSDLNDMITKTNFQTT